MRAPTLVRLGAVLAGVAVLLGAFAAHGMKGSFDAAALATFETGVRYQAMHALALVLCGALAARGQRCGAAAAAFATGILLFSGSLYALVWLDAKWLGAVTPLGGIAFVAGWALLAWRAADLVPAAAPPYTPRP
jgi:uncharacterized membrane protein YgdD (TMEM256/DUF423 family)